MIVGEPTGRSESWADRLFGAASNAGGAVVESVTAPVNWASSLFDSGVDIVADGAKDFVASTGDVAGDFIGKVFKPLVVPLALIVVGLVVLNMTLARLTRVGA
jgi:hypothetical protein